MDLKTKWITEKIRYDGTQLRSLFAYLEHGVLGNSCVAWRGQCDIPLEHVVDGEDYLDRAEIRGSDMVHFIIEVFDQNLFFGVAFQRLFSSIVSDVVWQQTGGRVRMIRSGDDLYYDKKKFSISIATRSVNSVLIHYAINVSNMGTPVPTCCLNDFDLQVESFAQTVLASLQKEFASITFATYKVKSV